MLDERACLQNALTAIRARTEATPGVGVVLGSGLGRFCDRLEDAVEIPFAAIPGFPLSTAPGHEGAFVLGSLGGRPIVALRGRLHNYEGYTQRQLTLPVRVMKRLGAETLILTNAAGGVNLSFSAGAIMLIRDHINASGDNPLRGENWEDFGPRFPDMSDIYTASLRRALLARASAAGVELREGVYAMYGGPSYETPAEIRAFRAMGADAVGMSTVPEAIVACHAGMRVLGLSCITNMAAGVLPQKLSHEEVVATAARVRDAFERALTLGIETACAASESMESQPTA